MRIKKLKCRLLVLLSFLSFSVMADGLDKPVFYGVYIKENDKYIELKPVEQKRSDVKGDCNGTVYWNYTDVFHSVDRELINNTGLYYHKEYGSGDIQFLTPITGIEPRKAKKKVGGYYVSVKKRHKEPITTKCMNKVSKNTINPKIIDVKKGRDEELFVYRPKIPLVPGYYYIRYIEEGNKYIPIKVE